MSPPANEDLLDELFRGYTVDGTTPLCLVTIIMTMRGKMQGQKMMMKKKSLHKHLQVEAARGARGARGH
jgi:hypothetical protein